MIQSGRIGQRENFFILLELSCDPPETDPAKIQEVLQNKKQEWIRWQENSEKRGTALLYLELLEEIELVMMDPQKRLQEAKEAERICADMLRQFEAELRILEGKGYLLPREVVSIAHKYKPYGVDQEQVQTMASCPVTEQPPKKSNELHNREVLDRMTAKTIQYNLSLMGFETLYQFLGASHHATAERLCLTAEKKRKQTGLFDSKDGKATIVQELCGICLQVFSSMESKQKYDQYLKVGKYPELSDLIDQQHHQFRYLGTESLLRLVNFGVEKYGMKVLDAEYAIRRYCDAYSIPVGEHSVSVYCPACAERCEPQNLLCKTCGAPLQGECPECKMPFKEGPATCSFCGFAIVDMVKGIPHIRDAENALIDNDWRKALHHLEYAAKFWPGYIKLEPLHKRAMQLKKSYNAYIQKITACMTHKKYYGALALVKEAQVSSIALSENMVQQVERVVDHLEKQIAEMQASPLSPQEEQVLRLAEVVSDSMELTHLMRRFPPDPPQRLVVSVHLQTVRLTWSVSASAGLKEYVVVRRQDTQALTAYDGDVLYEGTANSFLDKTAAPLCEYYYSVFTRRGGAFSLTGAAGEPILIVPELQRLRIFPTDMSAHIVWKVRPDIQEVAIWRKLGGEAPTTAGEGVRLENVRLDGYRDTGIKNNVVYWYYLCAVYLVGGRKVYSKGVCDSVQPRPVLPPVEYLTVEKVQDTTDTYDVHWKSAYFSDVLLFVSAKIPLCHKGQMWLLQDLMEEYHKLDVDMQQLESAQFRYDWAGGLYLFASAVSGKFATVGDIQYLVNVKDVQSPTYDVINQDILIHIEWPSMVDELVIVHRCDKYPDGPNDPQATTISYTREQYDYNDGVRIMGIEPAAYYITIYSVFITPQKTPVYSSGVHIFMNNAAKTEVFYKLVRSRKLFVQQNLITITLQSDLPVTFPRAMIVGKVGRLPLSRNDGIPLFEIEKETRIEDTAVYEYRTSSLPENLYLRLFLYDDRNYENIRLLPTEGLHFT